ncbi:MAG: hypothetical protein QN198_02405 [Armatimonadota bacterium]|nr:hypothetical protein [Armatimonadota bacterium]MDR5702436.1 hypothetical protein [Armatimonadota bacterium]
MARAKVVDKELENSLVAIEMSIRRFWLENNGEALATLIQRLKQVSQDATRYHSALTKGRSLLAPVRRVARRRAVRGRRAVRRRAVRRARPRVARPKAAPEEKPTE